MSGRIRSIKPDWRESESLGRCSDAARLLSATLITLADDYGNGRGSIEYLAQQTWTYSRDPRESLAKAREALRELVRIGYVVVYQDSGSSYFHLTGWVKHQRVDKPGKPHVPSPDSRVIRETLAKVPETLAPDLEEEREEEEEGNRNAEKGRSPEARANPASPDGFALADELRGLLVAEKPTHELAADSAWSRKRPAWARSLAGLVRSGRDKARASELLLWVFGDQGGTEYRFRVDSPKALREKWDRIELAMSRPGPRQGHFKVTGNEVYADGEVEI